MNMTPQLKLALIKIAGDGGLYFSNGAYLTPRGQTIREADAIALIDGGYLVTTEQPDTWYTAGSPA